MACMLILAANAATNRPSGWRIGTASTITALPTPGSQYASLTNMSPVRRVFRPSAGRRTLPNRALLAAVRPCSSMTASASWSGKRSRVELR